MKVKFWGVRGSIPSPVPPRALEAKLEGVLRGAQGVDLADPEQVRRYLDSLRLPARRTYGGHTSCVEVSSGGSALILDAGSGLYRLGRGITAAPSGLHPHTHHIFLSHLHWDHTIGLPFFAPLADSKSQVMVFGAHPGFRTHLLAQHSPPNFPVPLESLPGAISLREISPGQVVCVGCLRVTCMELQHPGRSFAFRVTDGVSTLVYATDAGFPETQPAALESTLRFFHDADVLILDAQFNNQENSTGREEWGHSSPLVGAELCARAEARHLVLFHHDPDSSDEEIFAMEHQVRTHLEGLGSGFPHRVTAAYEDLEIYV